MNNNNSSLKELILNSIEKEELRRQAAKAAGQFAWEGWRHPINRPGVGVFGPNGPITTKEALNELFNQAEQIEVIDNYDGADQEEVVAVRIQLPQGYWATVPRVFPQDIPQNYYLRDEVVLQPIPAKGKRESSIAALCRTMPPLDSRTNSRYHHVTLKIRLDDHSLKMWVPGFEESEGFLVLVGAHNTQNLHKQKQNNNYYHKPHFKKFGFGANKQEENQPYTPKPSRRRLSVTELKARA